jgi:hypothetical protein
MFGYKDCEEDTMKDIRNNMSNRDDDDTLAQDIIAYNKNKEFWKNLQQSLEDYLKFKDEMPKYKMWDKLDAN